MAAVHPLGTGAAPVLPDVRQITIQDLRWALRAGWSDFYDRRGDLIFVPLLYPLIGLGTAAITFNSSLLPILFPLVAGLSIMGPLVAAGFYELARRRERGQEASWSHFLDPLRAERRQGLVAIATMMALIFLGWLMAAWLLYQVTVGRLGPEGLGAFLRAVVTTPEGWTLIVFGNAVGGAIAAATLALTVVSVPMVVDQPVEARVAVQTSLRAVSANAGVMVRWGAIVAGLLVLGTIPLFVGLAVVLPVLGYATWHLYTRLVNR